MRAGVLKFCKRQAACFRYVIFLFFASIHDPLSIYSVVALSQFSRLAGQDQTRRKTAWYICLVYYVYLCLCRGYKTGKFRWLFRYLHGITRVWFDHNAICRQGSCSSFLRRSQCSESGKRRLHYDI